MRPSKDSPKIFAGGSDPVFLLHFFALWPILSSARVSITRACNRNSVRDTVVTGGRICCITAAKLCPSVETSLLQRCLNAQRVLGNLGAVRGRRLSSRPPDAPSRKSTTESSRTATDRAHAFSVRRCRASCGMRWSMDARIQRWPRDCEPSGRGGQRSASIADSRGARMFTTSLVSAADHTAAVWVKWRVRLRAYRSNNGYERNDWTKVKTINEPDATGKTRFGWATTTTAMATRSTRYRNRRWTYRCCLVIAGPA